MRKKKDLEADLMASVEARVSVEKERDELLDEIKAQSAIISKLQRGAKDKVASTLGDFTFDDLAAQMRLCIDAEIEVCASDATRSWTLVTIRKGLEALGSK